MKKLINDLKHLVNPACSEYCRGVNPAWPELAEGFILPAVSIVESVKNAKQSQKN